VLISKAFSHGFASAFLVGCDHYSVNVSALLQCTADRQVEVVECSAAIQVNFDERATIITIHPYEAVGSDAVVAGHSRQHLKDTVAALPSILLSMVGECNVSQGQAVLSATGLCIVHASLCMHA